VKTFSKRLLRVEESNAARRNQQGLTPAEVFRERICRRRAEETNRLYEEVLREHIAKSEAFWKTYDGDGSIVDILRYRFRRGPTPTLENQECSTEPLYDA